MHLLIVNGIRGLAISKLRFFGALAIGAGKQTIETFRRRAERVRDVPKKLHNKSNYKTESHFYHNSQKDGQVGSGFRTQPDSGKRQPDPEEE